MTASTDHQQHEQVPQANQMIGLVSAICMIFIWSGFIVFSRAGVITSLTAFDISALRFMVAGAVVLPFFRAWWPSHLPFHAKVIMSACGPGAIYSLLMYLGLTEASAAYAGIFSNGSMPIFTVALGMLALQSAPSRHQMLAIAVIVFGGLMLGFRGQGSGGGNVAGGIALFLSASAILSIYTFGVRYWRITPR